MKYLYIEIDFNDADYAGQLTPVTDEQLKRFQPIIDRINQKEFRSEHRCDHGAYIDEDYKYNPNLLEGLDPDIVEEFHKFYHNYVTDNAPAYVISEIKVLELIEDLMIPYDKLTK